MSYLQIYYKDIINLILDYFYPDEVLLLKDVLKLSSYQRELYYKRNVSVIPGSLDINVSNLIYGFLDDSKYEILLTRFTYDNKIDKMSAFIRFSKLGNLKLVKFIVAPDTGIHADNKYFSSIIYASEGGHLEVVKYLVL